MSNLIKLPVEYYNGSIYDSDGEPKMMQGRNSDGELSDQDKTIGEFIATAINSYAENQARIKELEAQVSDECLKRIEVEKRVIELEDKLRLGK